MDSRILDTIYKAIDNLNEYSELKVPLKKSPSTKLFGRESALDSLGLVNLISEIEVLVGEEFDLAITIADDRAMSMKNSPFKSIESLSKYVNLLIKEARDG
jgi:acyl carrier protein